LSRTSFYNTAQISGSGQVYRRALPAMDDDTSLPFDLPSMALGGDVADPDRLWHCPQRFNQWQLEGIPAYTRCVNGKYPPLDWGCSPPCAEIR